MGVAVNVTEVPVQIGFAEAAMETETGTGAPTDILTVLEVAGEPEAQTALEVSTTLTWSPFTRELLE